MATKIFWRFCWQDICSLRCRLAALPPQYIVVRKRINTATMSSSMSENADWPVAQFAKQRQSSAGQRPLFGPRFIPILYRTEGAEAMREKGARENREQLTFWEAKQICAHHKMHRS